MFKGKKTLVFGGTGFIGFHFCKKAVQLKMSVTSFSRNKPIKNRKINGVRYLQGDISKKKDLSKIHGYFDFVINLSGNVNHNNKKEVFRSHYLGLINIANFFLKKKIEKFIQIGSSGEYGNSKSPHYENTKCFPLTFYNQSKFKATKYLIKLYKKYNFPITILRPYQVYGPRQSINRIIPIAIVNCIKNKSFECSSGIQYRDFLYIDDFINAIFKSIIKKKTCGEIINLGSGKIIRIRDLIKKIKLLILGGNPIYGKLPMRIDENLKIYPSIKKAKKIMEWFPRTSLAKGLKKTIRDFKLYY